VAPSQRDVAIALQKFVALELAQALLLNVLPGSCLFQDGQVIASHASLQQAGVVAGGMLLIKSPLLPPSARHSTTHASCHWQDWTFRVSYHDCLQEQQHQKTPFFGILNFST